MKMLRLPRSKVKLGAPLPWNVRDADAQLLLSRGHVIETEHQLELLLERGAFVDAEEVKASASHAVEQVSQATPARSLNLFDLWDQATLDLQKLLAAVAVEGGLATRIEQFAGHVVEMLDANPDIAIYRCVRQEQQKMFYYGYAHSVRTASLCLLTARQLGWSPARTLSLVKAALTMNMSILDLQGQMAGQDFALRDKQRAQIGQHPQRAAELLHEAGVTDVDWLTAVAHHHERADGTGYPQGRSDPSEIAVVLRMADVFMARITPRVVRTAVSVQEATKLMFREDRGGSLSTAVIKQFGIYPPGDFVRLATGELAVAVQRTDNVRAPVVAVITDGAEKPIAKTVRRETAMPAFAITGNVANKSMLARLPPERLYGFSQVAPTGAPTV